MKASVAGRGAQAGFSLIELMIALVVTMIVTGSIYGLMATGGNAFKRDPEITDRQQNLRIALDLITRDVDIAGMRMGAGAQAFIDNLDGAGRANHTGGDSDVLEIVGSDGQCPDVYVDPDNPLDGNNVNFLSEVPDCYPEPGFVMIIFKDLNAKPGWGHKIHAQNKKLNYPNGQQPPNSGISTPETLKCSDYACTQPSTPEYIAQYEWIRYAIGLDDDEVPSLYRSDSGGYDFDSSAYTAPPGDGWDLVARGIEDLQVEYLREIDGTAANDQSFDWYDTPGQVVAANLDTLVRQVRITVSARTVAPNLQGSTSASDGPDAIRGDMTTVIAPRAAHFYLATTGAMPWR